MKRPRDQNFLQYLIISWPLLQMLIRTVTQICNKGGRKSGSRGSAAAEHLPCHCFLVRMNEIVKLNIWYRFSNCRYLMIMQYYPNCYERYSNWGPRIRFSVRPVSAQMERIFYVLHGIAQVYHLASDPAACGSIFCVPQNFIILDVAKIYRWRMEFEKPNNVDRTIHGL